MLEEVNYEKSRLRVAVTIFGRSTPVELDFGKNRDRKKGSIEFMRAGVGKFALDEGQPVGIDRVSKNSVIARIVIEDDHTLDDSYCNVGQSVRVVFNVKELASSQQRKTKSTPTTVAVSQ